MTAKVITCLIAACVVAIGGVCLHHGTCPLGLFGDKASSGCSTCSTDVCPLEATSAACCDMEEASPCCAKVAPVAVAKKACCSEGKASSSTEPIAAVFGGAALAAK